MEANEPPLDMRGTRLTILYCVKLMSNDVKPAYSNVFFFNPILYPLMQRNERLSNHYD